MPSAGYCRGPKSIRPFRSEQPRKAGWRTRPIPTADGCIRRVTGRIFNWRDAHRATARAVEDVEQAAQTFLSAGIDRWSREGRLAPSEAKELNTYLASDEVSGALHRLGAHLVLTTILWFPLDSLFRPAWTASFWAKAQPAWFRRRREPRWDR